MRNPFVIQSAQTAKGEAEIEPKGRKKGSRKKQLTIKTNIPPSKHHRNKKICAPKSMDD
jgi:hypothetical protein